MLLYNVRLILLLKVSAMMLRFVIASNDDLCHRHQTCSQCIHQPQCSWCSQKNFDVEKRCFNSAGAGDRVGAERCRSEHVTNVPVKMTLKNGTLGAPYGGRPLSALREGEVPHLIQITPLVVNLTLRPNVEVKVPVKFKLSKDYPLDVYYLTDSSYSMRADIAKVAAESERISRVMSNITKNFRLGCGKFAEKPLRPFNFHHKGCEQTEGVCYSSDNKIVYEFQNLLPLKADSAQFREKMQNIVVQGNRDDPEGGLSALMQVMVCKEAVGWRDNSNRLLIFSTDSSFHQAGEGKLAGVVQPNDGVCHLDPEGYYTHSTLLDYPSVSHIKYMASKHNIIIIFAITHSSSYEIYEKLSKEIKGSSFAKLDAYSSSVVDVIEEEYKKILSYVELNDNSSNRIDVKYRASCSNGAPMDDGQRCSNLKIGNEVNFEVTFKLKECPKDETFRSETFEIRPSGMNESVIVNVEMICECPCEKEGAVKNSPACNGKGTDKCGVCECDSDYEGWRCECHKTRQDSNSNSALSNMCLPPGNDTYTHALACSGNGKCECGKCHCYDKHISGTYCDCDDLSCRQKDNQLCSGHGECLCGRCECHEGWRHASPHDPVCDCDESQVACLSPGTALVCSAHGVCLCGKCLCHDDYAGDYCQVPPLNGNFCNEEVEACVECLAYGTGPKFDKLQTETNCSDDCSSYNVTTFATHQEIAERNRRSFQCNPKDHDGCSYHFFYYYEEMQLRIRAQREKPTCEKIDLVKYTIRSTAIGLFLGLLLLIVWKLTTVTLDRLEYTRFMKEQEKAKWDAAGNPLYKAPTTTIQNPMFQTGS